MSTAKKAAPAPSNEYVYGYALSSEGDFYSEDQEDFGTLEDARIYTEEELTEALKQCEKETGRDDVEKVALVIREVK